MALMLACCIGTNQQASAQMQFGSPFDFPLLLNGNFGEIRSNHFHGGIDIRTEGATHKAVKAIANGYISRIRVSFGSGYMLDITYPNGLSTTFRHLEGFMPNLERLVQQEQNRTGKYEVDIKVQPFMYKVYKGQQVAWSGNTGYSMGPHLHIDMYETVSKDNIDPLPFFRHWIKDTIVPHADGFMIFPQPGRGMVAGATRNISFGVGNGRIIQAWGDIGTGIRANDYMNERFARLGVRTIIVNVDGKEVFRRITNRLSKQEERMINTCVDGQYMKLFTGPGNTIRMLKGTNGRHGIVTINQERDYHFAFTLIDAFGNSSHYTFVVRGKRQQIPPLEYKNRYYFLWNRANILQEPGMVLTVPRGRLFDNLKLNYKVKPGTVASVYQLNDAATPLNGQCELRIALRKKPIADTKKYYVAMVTPYGHKPLGGTYEKGAMKIQITNLGTYTVLTDNTPPAIAPISPGAWGRLGKVMFAMDDAQSGITSYHATIDGKTAIFGRPTMLRAQYICHLDAKRIKKGGTHSVIMTALDKCGNKKEIRMNFIW